MKSIAKYIKEGFFKNLDIDILENIRRIFDKINNDKYYDYHIALNYNTCQIIIHNGKQKTNRNDMIINMLDFPDLVKNLAKNKIVGFCVMDRNTLGSSSYEYYKRTYGSSVVFILFKTEGGKNYRIKYDKAKYIATEME